MMRRLLAVAGTTAALLLAGSAAYADDCVNVSRAPAPCGTDCTQGPVIEGNWVWLPSVDANAPAAWGFATPGSAVSQGFGFPGGSGNYLNDRGGFSWLLENGVCANGNTARQTSHGVQTGCGQ
ncbi:hypothetical protein [Sinomonas atrocyanea]|uniref:hypothetical protein n=1 Tax=Sinomonas atrocyanea TaxID=37927 RepID=UPI003D998B49